MIVPTMTDEEIYNEIKNDFANLREKIRFCEGKFQATLKKAKYFPCAQSYPHTTKERKNKFIITYTARNIGDKNRPLISVHCRFRDKYGEASASINWQLGIVIIYTNHFFVRYRERVLKDISKSMDETIESFFDVEWSSFGIRITQELEDVYHCFEGHFSDDKVDVLFFPEKGYAFGLKKENLFVVKTIITEEMLSEQQRTLFLQLKQKRQKYNENFYGCF